jgi:hypothetical protein
MAEYVKLSVEYHDALMGSIDNLLEQKEIYEDQVARLKKLLALAELNITELEKERWAEMTKMQEERDKYRRYLGEIE